MARCDAGACIVASADGTNIGGLARSADPQCRDSGSRGVEPGAGVGGRSGAWTMRDGASLSESPGRSLNKFLQEIDAERKALGR